MLIALTKSNLMHNSQGQMMRFYDMVLEAMRRENGKTQLKLEIHFFCENSNKCHHAASKRCPTISFTLIDQCN